MLNDYARGGKRRADYK
jgi:hypothetical protein